MNDEPTVRESFRMVLPHLGHVVQTASSESAALDLVIKNPFYLIFIDYFMPDMKVDELARLIKQSHPDLPILMITAYADTVRADCLYGGLVDHMLSKPFEIPQLMETMILAMCQHPPDYPSRLTPRHKWDW